MVCVLRFNFFRWVLLRQTHVFSHPFLNSIPIQVIMEYLPVFITKFNDMIPNIGILYTCKYSIHGLWICHEILDSTKNCLSFGRRQEGLPPMTDRKQAKLRIELFEGHRPWAFRKTWNHLGKGTYALRCFLEAKLWIVLLDFVSWLWIGRSFESSQECELTHVQSSSKNTFKKKGWVIKLSVCQNFAVRNARGCGSLD